VEAFSSGDEVTDRCPRVAASLEFDFSAVEDGILPAAGGVTGGLPLARP